MTAPRTAHCVIAGGGPAGMMAGYLMARAGVDTIVLEKHGDFLRDFRGDTVHPSTMEIFHDLGLLERFLQRPHQRMDRIAINFAGQRIEMASFATLPTVCRFIAFMPQWEFLDFLASEGKTLPHLTLLMSTKADKLIETNGRITGVVATGPQGPFDIIADLTIAADGRTSGLRQQSGLSVTEIGAPIDVLWFSLPRTATAAPDTLLNAGAGNVVVTIDRGDYWQCAYVIDKGTLADVRARGIDALQETVLAAAPHLGADVQALRSWDEVKLLSVTMDRLDQWARPGFLCIGDAAHAMSPIGGVGINLAVQDAVATANLLAARLAGGTLTDADLDRVQKRRAFPAKVIQFLQTQIQQRVIGQMLASKKSPSDRPPLLFHIVTHTPFLQRLAARMIGLGVRPEHPTAPDVASPG